MAITCSACGTVNADSAAFCNMCRAIFAKKSTRPSSAPAAPPSGLELAIEPPSHARSSPPAAGRADATPIDTRPVALGSGYVADVAQSGSTLTIRYHAASVGGIVRAVLLGALGAFFLWGAQMLHAEAPHEPPLGPLLLGPLGVLVLVIALWNVGFAIVHTFEAEGTVRRRRTWMGIPLGSWEGRAGPTSRVEIEIGEVRRRSQIPFHKLWLRTQTGDTLVAGGTDMTSLGIVGRDVARFVGAPVPRNF